MPDTTDRIHTEPYRDPGEPAAQVARCPEHLCVSLEAARQSTVLLWNDRGTLPLALD